MRKIYSVTFFISVGLLALSAAAVIYFGLNFGTDFKGGSLLEIEFAQRPDTTVVQEVLKKNNPDLGDVSVGLFGEKGMILRSKEIGEAEHQKVLSDLQSAFGEIQEKRFNSVGGIVGQELRQNSLTAMIIMLVLIVVYIAFVFRKLSSALSPWSMGLAAIIALAHAVVIPMGVFAILGRYYGVEITAVFVAAVLTILGYSVSDVVVVFDRVRENVLRSGSREKFSDLVHNSIMQTLTRSINNTLATLLSLVAIYFFGGESIKYFALALILGIFLGPFSSVFVASPILVWWSRKRN
ncbi:MAG: protein translocase subunit SecF [bacterium]|nr:protein translocase subunit SecF [bacterium]